MNQAKETYETLVEIIDARFEKGDINDDQYTNLLHMADLGYEMMQKE